MPVFQNENVQDEGVWVTYLKLSGQQGVKLIFASRSVWLLDE
jgi:hypothetical protein